VDVVQTENKLLGSPAGASIPARGSTTFSAVAYDQFGHAMRTQPTFAYSVVSGPGAIDSTTGIYTASETTGALLVEITDGTLTTTVKATVT
jgi:hypothetical protein